MCTEGCVQINPHSIDLWIESSLLLGAIEQGSVQAAVEANA